jgi:pimeloyl-ACP methyl ester carboxylesterase
MPAGLGNSVARNLPRNLRLLVFCSAVLLLFSARSSAQTSPALQPINSSHTGADATIVIGFLGGHVDRANSHHVEVQLAQKLRDEFGSGIHAEIFENRRYPDAYNRILEMLDTDRDGRLSADEKRRAHIILYGHSWGAAAVLALARQLETEGIPVQLTVQVDSVAHFGQDDSTIPPNVAKAANFYQPQGTVRGQPAIKAADPSRTEILGNFRFDYSAHPVACEGYPWWNRYFMKSHTEIECDPRVWSQVESLIRAELLSATSKPAVAFNAQPTSAKP